MTPTALKFPGFGGTVTACVEQQAGARRAVIVVADPDDAGAAVELRGALVEAGYVVAWLPASHIDASRGMARVEDIAGLLGTLFVSSNATVGLVARGQSCAAALMTIEGAYDLVGGAVLVGAGDEPANSAEQGPVPIARLDAAVAPTAVVEALAHLGFTI